MAHIKITVDSRVSDMAHRNVSFSPPSCYYPAVEVCSYRNKVKVDAELPQQYLLKTMLLVTVFVASTS